LSGDGCGFEAGLIAPDERMLCDGRDERTGGFVGEVTWRETFQNGVFVDLKTQIKGDRTNKWFIVATALLEGGKIILSGGGAVMTFIRTKRAAEELDRLH
jgi:hypothetical protein